MLGLEAASEEGKTKRVEEDSWKEVTLMCWLRDRSTVRPGDGSKV